VLDWWNEYGIFHGVFQYLDIDTATRIFQLMMEINVNINYSATESWRFNSHQKVNGRTLLDIAAQRGYIDLVQTVLGCGAFLTEDTLNCAIHSKNEDLISYVLHQGGKVNSLASFNKTPYSEAVYNGYMDLAQDLEDKGALDEIEDKSHFKPAVCAALAVGNLGVLKYFVERIADLRHEMHRKLGHAPQKQPGQNTKKSLYS